MADLKHQAERVRQLTINPEALPDTSREGTTVPNINIIRRVVLQPKPTPLATLPGTYDRKIAGLAQEISCHCAFEINCLSPSLRKALQLSLGPPKLGQSSERQVKRILGGAAPQLCFDAVIKQRRGILQRGCGSLPHPLQRISWRRAFVLRLRAS